MARRSEKSKYGVAQFKTKDAVYYLNVPSSTYTTSGLTLTPKCQNRWLERSADDHSARVTLGDFFRDLELDDQQLQPEVTVNPGQRPTVTITQRNGTSLTIAGRGEPLPLAYSTKSGNAYLFADYGKPVTIEVPTETTKLSCGQSSCDY